MLESIYIELLKQYNIDLDSISILWNELNEKYSDKKRHYHNLTHLSDLYAQLQIVKPKLDDWNVILFSLFYHDAIYNATKKDNEERSAALAEKRMKQIGVSNSNIEKCYAQILATKSHNVSGDLDTNYFTDADLSILGKDWQMYNAYCENIRKEYIIYPNFLYRRGRQKVVKHFLEMNRIFKTEEFFELYETKAKDNLNKELNLLQK